MTAQNHYHLYIRDRHCPYTGYWIYMNRWQTEEQAISYAKTFQNDCPHWDVQVNYGDRTVWEKYGVPKEEQSKGE